MTQPNENSNGITAHISGLKCDNSTCHYEDQSIKVEDYEEYINAPCPECGESLLTQADYDRVQQLLELVAIVNDMPDAESDSNGKTATLSFGMNGTGDVAVLRVIPSNKRGAADGE